MKKIIFVGEFPNQNYTNGIAESNLRLLKNIESNYDLYFFEDKPFHNMRNYSLSKIFSIIYFLKNYAIFILSRLKKSFLNFDFLYIVLSVNSPFGIIKNFFQIILLRPFSRKLIIHIHRSDISNFDNCIPIKILQKYILISSHKIIVLSKDICLNSPLIQFKDKVFVLKNTLSPELENSLLSINYKNLDDTYRTRFFFYSNILLSKGIKIYIDLFNHNKNLDKKFSIVAGFPNNIKLVQYALDNDHKYLGHVTKNIKLELFENNDCIIFCSPNEGLPLILLEAMSSGVFIISTNVGFIPELLGKDYPFMCNPNVKDLSNTVDKYFKLSKNQRFEIIKRMRQRYIELFSFEQWSKKTQLIFIN